MYVPVCWHTCVLVLLCYSVSVTDKLGDSWFTQDSRLVVDAGEEAVDTEPTSSDDRGALPVRALHHTLHNTKVKPTVVSHCKHVSQRNVCMCENGVTTVR